RTHRKSRTHPQSKAFSFRSTGTVANRDWSSRCSLFVPVVDSIRWPKHCSRCAVCRPDPKGVACGIVKKCVAVRPDFAHGSSGRAIEENLCSLHILLCILELGKFVAMFSPMLERIFNCGPRPCGGP